VMFSPNCRPSNALDCWRPVRITRGKPIGRIYEYTPFCNGPDEVKSPN
jgi:hypothetical protein